MTTSPPFDFMVVRHPIYRCILCGFEVDVYKTPAQSNGFDGYCPKCSGILRSLEMFKD